MQGTAAAPKKTVKAIDSTSSSAAGGLDGLPREDISEKITPTLLKGLESSDWKVWFSTVASHAIAQVVSNLLIFVDSSRVH